MTATQIRSRVDHGRNSPNEITLRGLKVKTPNAFKVWEDCLDCTTGEVYEKIIFESGDMSEIKTPELYGEERLKLCI